MIAVIFEVEPHADERDTYLGMAAELKSLLEGLDGFLGIERFESLTTPGKLLSLSWWRDEQAVARWRQTTQHRDAQRAGREHVFRSYRLRVAQVTRDYGMHDRERVPEDSRAVHR